MTKTVYPNSGNPDDLAGVMDPAPADILGLGLVYPPGGWNDTVQVLTVAAGETKTAQITLGASVSSIQQPIPVTVLGPNQVPAVSCYTITNADGTPMPPAEWLRFGGAVSVMVNEDTTTATVTMVGAGYASKGPFTLSLNDGTNDFSTLRLIGTGVAYVKKAISLATGVDQDLAATDVGVTIDNEFIESEAQAWDVGARTLYRFLGARQTIHVTTTGINRIGDSGSYDFQTLAWITAQLPADATAAQVSALLAEFGGDGTVGGVQDWLASQTVDGFANQAFGNIAGARVVFDGSWYRITSATVQPDSIVYDAVMDMVCGDISAGLEPRATLADLSAAFAGKTIQDWDARPVPNGVSL